MAKVINTIYVIMLGLVYDLFIIIITCLIIIELLSMLIKGVKRTLECIAYKHVYKEKVIE